MLTQGTSFIANDHGRSHTFKIYDETDAPFDATAYNSPIVNVLDHAGTSVILPITGSWTAQASGAGTFAFSPENHLTNHGPHYLQVQLEKSGTVLSTERRKITVFASA